MFFRFCRNHMLTLVSTEGLISFGQKGVNQKGCFSFLCTKTSSKANTNYSSSGVAQVVSCLTPLLKLVSLYGKKLNRRRPK